MKCRLPTYAVGEINLALTLVSPQGSVEAIQADAFLQLSDGEETLFSVAEAMDLAKPSKRAALNS